MRAVELMKQRNVDALLLFPGVNMYYLTGFMIGLSERPTMALIPFNNEPVLIVPELERELRGQRPWITNIEIWREWENPFEIAANIIVKMGLAESNIGVCEKAPWGWIKRLEKFLPKVDFIDITDIVNSLRMVKTPSEIERIEKACDITCKAVKAAFESLQNGISELEVSYIVQNEMRKHGASPAFATVLFGERAALPHATSSNRKLEKGDIVLIDAGAIVDFYYSDLTRTIIYGKPASKQERIWKIVYRANQTAIQYVKPGIPCEDVDRVARQIIDSEGYGEQFIHRLGHGIGLEVHEHPYLVKGNKQPLQSGMTFTIEPGIYLKNEFGIRIEDTVLCTSGGSKVLTKLEYTMSIN